MNVSKNASLSLENDYCVVGKVYASDLFCLPSTKVFATCYICCYWWLQTQCFVLATAAAATHVLCAVDVSAAIFVLVPSFCSGETLITADDTRGAVSTFLPVVATVAVVVAAAAAGGGSRAATGCFCCCCFVVAARFYC